MHIECYVEWLMLWYALPQVNHHRVYGPWNLPQTSLGGIWRMFRRVFNDWMSGNCVAWYLSFRPSQSYISYIWSFGWSRKAGCYPYHVPSTYMPHRRFWTHIITSHFSLHTCHPPPPPPLFLGFGVIRDSAHSLLHVPPYIYIIEHSYCTPFDRLFS